ncbi:MAG: zf-HC2 domain-containing protein [Candidatus Zixiibacteriota bacterium]
MKCRKALKIVCCYADLDLPQKEKLDEHLQSCPDCFHEFSLIQSSMQVLRETLTFKESEDFWKDYRVDLKLRIPAMSLWKRVWAEVEQWTSLIRTPVLGPVPAYVFSFVLVILIALSILPGFLSPQRAEAFSNNLVIYEGGLLSAVDDGVVTIYTLKGKQ